MKYMQHGRTFGKGQFTEFWNVNKDAGTEASVVSCVAGLVAIWRYPSTSEKRRRKGGWARACFVVKGLQHSLRVTPCPSRRGLICMARRYVRSQLSGRTDEQIARAATVEICGTFASHIEIPCAGGGKAVISTRSVMGVVLGAIRDSKA